MNVFTTQGMEGWFSTRTDKVKAAIAVRINSILIDKTDLKSRTDRKGTTGRTDMAGSMTGLTSSNLNKVPIDGENRFNLLM